MTLDRPPWTTPAALDVMRPVFVALLGAEPPDILDWDDLTLLSTATGRRVLTAPERDYFGPLAKRFPLLS